MGQVDIFGTYHVDRPSKVKRELAEFSDDADVLFTEVSRGETDTPDYRELLLRNPIFRITGWVLNTFWGIPGLLSTRQFGPIDAVVTKIVAQERNIDIEPVDMNIVQHASNVALPLTILSWISCFLTVSAFVAGIVLLSPLLVLSAIALGFAPAVIFAYATLSERDSAMAENIEHILTTRDGGVKGCLVVGHKHMEGVIKELEERNIEVGRKHKSKFLRQRL